MNVLRSTQLTHLLWLTRTLSLCLRKKLVEFTAVSKRHAKVKHYKFKLRKVLLTNYKYCTVQCKYSIIYLPAVFIFKLHSSLGFYIRELVSYRGSKIFVSFSLLCLFVHIKILIVGKVLTVFLELIIMVDELKATTERVRHTCKLLTDPSKFSW